MRLTFSRVAYPYPSPASAEMVAILNELRKERRTRWVHLSFFLKASLKTTLAISSRWVRRQQNRVSKVLWQITN